MKSRTGHKISSQLSLIKFKLKKLSFASLLQIIISRVDWSVLVSKNLLCDETALDQISIIRLSKNFPCEFIRENNFKPLKFLKRKAFELMGMSAI